MIAPTPMTAGALEPAVREEDRWRGATPVAACAVVDAVAAGILLVGTPLPSWLEVLVAAASHAAAVLFAFRLTHARHSRAWLSAAALAAVPCVGAAVATASFVTQGRGTIARRRRKARRRPALPMAAIRHLADALSPFDALDSGDDEQRRAALSALSKRADREAIALLRRAAAGSDPDLALSAALVLDEIGERAERRAERRAGRRAERQSAIAVPHDAG